MTTNYTGIQIVDHLLQTAEDERKEDLSQTTRRAFLEEANRYLFDFHLNPDEWEEFDSTSDASYFGVWVNKAKLRTLRFAEGDVILVQYDDADSFDREVGDVCQLLSPAPAFVSLGEDGSVTRYYQDRSKFFIDPERAAALRAAGDTSEGEK